MMYSITVGFAAQLTEWIASECGNPQQNLRKIVLREKWSIPICFLANSSFLCPWLFVSSQPNASTHVEAHEVLCNRLITTHAWKQGPACTIGHMKGHARTSHLACRTNQQCFERGTSRLWNAFRTHNHDILIDIADQGKKFVQALANIGCFTGQSPHIIQLNEKGLAPRLRTTGHSRLPQGFPVNRNHPSWHPSSVRDHWLLLQSVNMWITLCSRLLHQWDPSLELRTTTADTDHWTPERNVARMACDTRYLEIQHGRG